MMQSDVLLRFCCKVLVWALISGIATDFVVSKTVTHLPTEPCSGENCNLEEQKLDENQPAWEPVIQMQQQEDILQDGNEEQEVVASKPGGINIDPDSLLHPVGGGHVHDGASRVDEDAHDLGAAAPDVKKELHGAMVGMQVDDAGSGEERNLEDHGPDMDSVLHGGVKHIHSPAKTENLSQSLEHDGVIGVDPEDMLHAGKDVHSHGEADQTVRENREGNFDLGTDIDAMLHDGDHQAHSPDRKPKRESDAIPEVPIGATDPEEFLHDGNGHVHSQSVPVERHDPESRPYGAADPDEILHGPDEKHMHTVRQAMDGSRPLSGAKDPDVVGIDVKPVDIRIGTLQSEETADYHKWKSDKEKQSQDPSQASGWLSGFSYIKDAIIRDLEVVRKRYLGILFGNTTDEEGSSGEGHSRRTHDEA